MKSLVFNIAWLVSAIFATGAAAADAPVPAPATNAPNIAAMARIQFDAQVYDFGRVAAGEAIQHTFIVSNAGDATLIISAVRPSCGCTTAGQWTKEIEPGKTGVIPVQIKSSYLRGTVDKQVTVTSNDKSQPNVVLRLRGIIWKPIEMSPAFAWLRLNPGGPSNVSTVIHISNKSDAPLTLSPPESADAHFTGTLKTIEPGKEYELTVATVAPMPAGNVTGSITIKTSMASVPVLTVPITAISPQPAILVTPLRISLEGAAPGQPVTRTISIQGTAPQGLKLSDAAVNAKGVDIQIKELLPGRRYNLTLTFADGFQVPAGQQLELTVRSNYPQYPVIKVPISQPSPSAAVATRKG
jgi:hypothetical protein